MPTIVVEDGTNIVGANSYVDIAYLDVYATDRNLSIPSSQVDKEIYLLRAMDYLEYFRDSFKGSKTNLDQALQWPRDYAYIDGLLFDKDSIPKELKNAQCQLVVEQQSNTILFPKPLTSVVEGAVIQKTVGPLTKRYSAYSRLANPYAPIKITSVNIFLNCLLDGCSSVKYTIRI